MVFTCALNSSMFLISVTGMFVRVVVVCGEVRVCLDEADL